MSRLCQWTFSFTFKYGGPLAIKWKSFFELQKEVKAFLKELDYDHIKVMESRQFVQKLDCIKDKELVFIFVYYLKCIIFLRLAFISFS